MSYTRKIEVTVDADKSTEKVYKIDLKIDLSSLTEEDLREYCLRDLTVKWANSNRSKGHTHMEAMKGEATYIAPKPGTRSAVDPFTALAAKDMTDAEIEKLEALLAAKRKK